jgi:hypothetical protein
VIDDEFGFEPIHGLPDKLPAGERILWQGAPDWRVLAIRAFHARKVAIYGAVLLAWYAVSAVVDGASIGAAAIGTLTFAPLALAAVAILAGLAWLFARSTVYTITNRRVVMRIGVALPITFNLPFARIAGAGLKVFGRGVGDLPLQLAEDDKIAWFLLWPHARPWRLSRPEPMLRAIPDAAKVAEILAAAMTAAAASRSAPAASQPVEGVPRVRRSALASAA